MSFAKHAVISQAIGKFWKEKSKGTKKPEVN